LSTADPDLEINRIIMGLRDVSDSPNFQGFINLSQRQNNAGILVQVVGALASFTTDVTAPSGQAVTYNPGAADPLDKAALITIDQSIANDYRGSFHAYLRAKQTGGSAGSLGLQLRFYDQDFTQAGYTSDVAYFENTNNWQVLDMGEVEIGGSFSDSDLAYRTYFEIWGVTGNSADNARLYDLILIPIDEWFGDFVDKDLSTFSMLGGLSDFGDRYADIDSIVYPKQFVRSNIRDLLSGVIYTAWRKQSVSGRVIFNNGVKQRVYILCGKYNIGSAYWLYPPAISCSFQAQKSQRYLGHRGSS
jgi:hypothetical protein